MSRERIFHDGVPQPNRLWDCPVGLFLGYTLWGLELGGFSHLLDPPVPATQLVEVGPPFPMEVDAGDDGRWRRGSGGGQPSAAFGSGGERGVATSSSTNRPLLYLSPRDLDFHISAPRSINPPAHQQTNNFNPPLSHYGPTPPSSDVDPDSPPRKNADGRGDSAKIDQSEMRHKIRRPPVLSFVPPPTGLLSPGPSPDTLQDFASQQQNVSLWLFCPLLPIVKRPSFS